MVKQIRSLDSDMQTLVYENYNKFISATGKRSTTLAAVEVSAVVMSKYIIYFSFVRHYQKDEE